jgi:hypothetical protein
MRSLPAACTVLVLFALSLAFATDRWYDARHGTAALRADATATVRAQEARIKALEASAWRQAADATSDPCASQDGACSAR